jgi:hypothetical protein
MLCLHCVLCVESVGHVLRFMVVLRAFHLIDVVRKAKQVLHSQQLVLVFN